jgi:hypothetical protein
VLFAHKGKRFFAILLNGGLKNANREMAVPGFILIREPACVAIYEIASQC